MNELVQLAAVGAVLALALAGAAWTRRRPGGVWWGSGRGAATGGVRRLGRVALTQHHTVELLQTGGRVLVVAFYPGGCTLLETMDAAELSRCEERA